MKKTLKVFLVSALLAVLLAFSASAKEFDRTGNYGDNIRYEFDGEVLTLSGTGPMMYNNGDMIKIPWYPHVKENISEETEKITIKKVVIEEGITSVGDFIFINCKELEEVVLPESVTTLVGGCFTDCTSLKTIRLPENLEYIGPSTFSCCTSLSNIKLPDRLKVIESGAFLSCSSLCEITLPENLERIEFGAFGATGIENVYIPKNVTYISEMAFTFFNDDFDDSYTAILENIFVDEENETYCDIDGVLFSKDKTKLITYPHGNQRTSYAIPDGTETLCTGPLGAGAFYYAENLETLIIPESLNSIEEGVFFDWIPLKDVYYLGTEEQWDKIAISDYNDCLLNATIHFAHKHEYKKEIIVEATCEKEGKVLYTCDCGDSYTETISLSEHIDKNRDGNCDVCNEKLRETKTLFEIILALIHAVLDFLKSVF